MTCVIVTSVVRGAVGNARCVKERGRRCPGLQVHRPGMIDVRVSSLVYNELLTLHVCFDQMGV